jgi:hypothetical protein
LNDPTSSKPEAACARSKVLRLPTEAELIELENWISSWNYHRRDRMQVLIDMARAQLPPIPPMPPLDTRKWRWRTLRKKAGEQ